MHGWSKSGVHTCSERWKSLCVSELLPTTMARSQSPFCRADTARATATSEDEHAVSSVTVGPCVPRKYATYTRKSRDSQK
jgi:hypothetical protein